MPEFAPVTSAFWPLRTLLIGQVGITADGLADGVEAQARQVFANIKVILEDAGSSWDRMVDVTMFLTNMAGDFATVNRIYAEYFTSNQPTRTTVEVGALPTAIAIELKVIATVGEA